MIANTIQRCAHNQQQQQQEHHHPKPTTTTNQQPSLHHLSLSTEYIYIIISKPTQQTLQANKHYICILRYIERTTNTVRSQNSSAHHTKTRVHLLCCCCVSVRVCAAALLCASCVWCVCVCLWCWLLLLRATNSSTQRCERNATEDGGEKEEWGCFLNMCVIRSCLYCTPSLPS